MKYVKISPIDNVAVALTDLRSGETACEVVLKTDVPAGHKFALCDIKAGENVIKYGSPIGCAKEDIKAGDWVHTHNVKTNLDGILEYKYSPVEVPDKAGKTATFKGFRRKSGKVGVRNEIWIIPTVGCVNSPAEIIAKEAEKYLSGSVDGVYAFTHPFGCSQLGGDHLNTQKALAGLCHHPNAGGVLVIGLGCENNNLDEFRKVLGDVDTDRVRFLVSQDVEDEIEEGLKIVRELIDIASCDERVDTPSSELVVGLKCGGSDGFSGITANPTVGVFSDMLVYGGGTAILTEVPEMFGAETLLMERCENREIFDKTVKLINDFKEYFMRYDQVVYENPSPGNKKGGITTLEDKSLGCIQKGGTAPVDGVLGYAQRVETPGLNLMYGPGNDLVSATNLAAAGAQIIVFTTGRGTPFGCPVPTVKVSTNNALYAFKKNWIDFNAGTVADGEAIDRAGARLMEKVLLVASGENTKGEKQGYRGIAIYKDGVTL